jgi:hypothetical protein
MAIMWWPVAASHMIIGFLHPACLLFMSISTIETFIMNNKLLLPVCVCCFTMQLNAQPTQQQRIQDTVLGWYTTQNPNEVPKPFQYQGRTFSTKQQQHMMQVIEWMKKTYTPVAGLGTFRRMIFSDSYSNPPHSYGVDFRVWNVSFSKEYLDGKGNFKPVPEEYTQFGISANAIAGSNPVSFMNSTAQYVFTWQPDGYENYRYPKMKQADPKIDPNVYKYPTRITGTTMAVYIAPGNKLPFARLTKSEFLAYAEEAIDRLPQTTNASNSDWVKQQIPVYKKTIAGLRIKYMNSLDEPAIINTMQPNESDFSAGKDIFEVTVQTRNSNTLYEVCRMDKTLLEKCRSDQPQWLVVWFPFKSKEDGNKLYEMCRVMRQHFNYDYAFNYFFNPGQVKGVPYKPMNEELLKTTLDSYRKKNNWSSPPGNPNNASLPANVHFMDDFSSNAEGSNPSGWFFSSKGSHSSVVKINNITGKWFKLGFGNAVTATSLKKPLPQNFTLEYDIATDDFTSRTGGAVQLYLSTFPLQADGREDFRTPGSTILLTITSGNQADFNNNNYRGQASIQFNSGSSARGEKEYQLLEFNNKDNKVHAAVQVSNGEIKLFINNKLVAASKDFKVPYAGDCTNCTVPAGQKFNTIKWTNRTDDVDKTGVYISNIKITKN